MGTRHAVLGLLAAGLIAMGAAPAGAQDQQDEEQQISDDMAAAMLCSNVYLLVAERSKGMAAAEAYDAAGTAMNDIAMMLGTAMEDEEVKTRVRYGKEIVGQMLDEGESLSVMVEECNEAYGLSIPAE